MLYVNLQPQDGPAKEFSSNVLVMCVILAPHADIDKVTAYAKSEMSKLSKKDGVISAYSYIEPAVFRRPLDHLLS